MKRVQWVTLGVTFFIAIALYASTKHTLFGEKKAKSSPAPIASNQSSLGTDSILYYSKQFLSKEKAERLNTLENSITRGDVIDQKLHIFHQLAKFWKDSARIFAPFAYYTAEAARLENSEKSLTFAAHLFLNNLVNEEDQRLKQWEALQAKELFERSLKLNPGNDSSKVGLGAATLYGGLANPMEGIQLIREVVEKDSTNVFAHMTLGRASLMSGQIDKAIERFSTTVRLQPDNVEAVLMLADIYEKRHDHDAAIYWYQKSITLVPNQEFKKEVEKRISEIKTKH